MDSPTSSSRLPIHLQQPSSSSSSSCVAADPEVFTSIHNIRPGQTFVSVQTLTKESFHIAVNAKTKVHDVLWKCGERLSLSEDKLFGLAFRQPTDGIGGDQPRHEYYFLDPAAKIMKYAHKQPRFANWHSRSTENRPILVLYFRVRVYIDQVGLLTCPKAREHYYLQLKDNFLDHWAGRHSVSEERCWYMAALALITDKGTDYLGFFRAEQYFPLWVINERGLEYIRNNLPAACDDIINEGRDRAMEKFMIEAGRSPFALNCHLYGLRRHKMDSVDNAVLGINAKGIEMCDIGENGDRIPLRSLQWNRVTRLSFDRKKLTIIGSDGTKMSLYAQTEHKAKYLLELCRAVHQTLLVMSHLYATMAPPPKPYQEMSVDGLSTSSTSGIGSGDHDKDSDSLSSTCGDRCHGSISSKLRLRIKMDSNLDVKIEKMELDHIRQERAASQSSKASDESERCRWEVKHPSHICELSGATSSTHTVTTSTTTQEMSSATRPSSIDNASQTIETGSARNMVDVNFNKPTQQQQQQRTRIESLRAQHSIEVADQMQSLSVNDLRAWQQHMFNSGSPEKLTRSETCIDVATPELAIYNGGNISSSSAAGRFVKKNSAGSRAANAINRVHSMPSHYHVNGIIRPSPVSSTPPFDELPMYQMSQSVHVANSRPRDPPSYDSTPAVVAPSTPPRHVSSPPSPPPSSSGPLAATEAAGDRQPAFPPASATQFLSSNEVGGDADGFSTQRIQKYPLLLQLWNEHRMSVNNEQQQQQMQQKQHQQYYQQSMVSTNGGGALSHQRRPSSCIDLTSIDALRANSFIPPTFTSIRRASDFYFDSTAHQSAPMMAMMAPPKQRESIPRPQQQQGNIHLPPPPPYQQPSQLVN